MIMVPAHVTDAFCLVSFEKRRLGFFDGGLEGYRKVSRSESDLIVRRESS
jgi:hypothetical protein